MASVCAVVLTYNRKEMLERCLTALAQQARPCDRILVIDNAGSDGTFEMLAEKWSDLVDARRLPVNIGAAGGYCTGMRLAYGLGSDFIWAMDDDVIPEPEALETLLEAQDRLNARDIHPPYLVSMAYATCGLLTEVPDVSRRANKLGFPNWGELLQHGIVATLGATFASILLPRETLRDHGLPIASMFIFGEDREFTVRVTQDQPGFAVGTSRVLHARRLEGALDIRTEANAVRLGYHYYLHRNTTYTTLRYERPAKIALHFWRQTLLFGGLLLRGRWRRAGIVGRGTMHGLVYRPHIDRVDDPFDTSEIVEGRSHTAAAARPPRAERGRPTRVRARAA